MKIIAGFALLAAMLVAIPTGPAVAQYRWTDASGKVNSGDRPPSDAKDVRPVGGRSPSSPSGDAGSGLPYEVRRAMERAPVVLYTAPDCQPCVPAVALLRERGVPFTERTVSSPDDLQELRRISGGLRLPYVTVGAQTQNGFNPDLWLSMLDAAGYPKGSMLPKSYQWPAPQPLVPPPPKAEVKAGAPAAESSLAAEPARR